MCGVLAGLHGEHKLIALYKPMENPVKHRAQCLCIIMRCFRTVIQRNEFWDKQEVPMLTLNDTTLCYEYTRDTLDRRYHYYLVDAGFWYFFDIRELIKILRQDYGEARQPYTNRRLTSYEKYRMVRHYYTLRKDPRFVEIPIERPSARDVQRCLREVGAVVARLGVSSEFETVLSNLRPVQLYELMHRLIVECRAWMAMGAWQYVPALTYFFVSELADNFRATCYQFLTYLIESPTDEKDRVSLAHSITYITSTYDVHSGAGLNTHAHTNHTILVPSDSDEEF